MEKWRKGPVKVDKRGESAVKVVKQSTNKDIPKLALTRIIRTFASCKDNIQELNYEKD